MRMPTGWPRSRARTAGLSLSRAAAWSMVSPVPMVGNGGVHHRRTGCPSRRVTKRPLEEGPVGHRADDFGRATAAARP